MNHCTLYEDLWREADTCRDDLAAFWSRRAPSYNAHMQEENSAAQRQKLVALLAAKAHVDKSSAVLDLGCGPGGHALAMAAWAGQVEAFDIAPAMIELAQRNAAERHVNTVAFRVLDWDKAQIDALGWRKAFQLVFASKTPAVHDSATLEKMLACSKAYACIITHVDTRNSVREALKQDLPWDEAKARVHVSFYSTFNLLWLWGYYPEISYLERQWESSCPLEDAIPMYNRFFEKQGPLSPEHKVLLRRRLEALAEDGLVHESVRARLALLFWDVRQCSRQRS